jgi:hypothetical protein
VAHVRRSQFPNQETIVSANTTEEKPKKARTKKEVSGEEKSPVAATATRAKNAPVSTSAKSETKHRHQKETMCQVTKRYRLWRIAFSSNVEGSMAPTSRIGSGLSKS